MAVHACFLITQLNKYGDRHIDAQETHIVTRIQRERHRNSCYQDPDAFLRENVLRTYLAAVKFRHLNLDVFLLASLLRVFRAALKSDTFSLLSVFFGIYSRY